MNLKALCLLITLWTVSATASASWFNKTERAPAIKKVDFLAGVFKNFATSNASRPYSLQVEKNIVRTGSSSLRFEIRQGDIWKRGRGKEGHGTYRVEVQEETYAKFETDYWYEFSIWMPNLLVERDTRLVIGQWHGEADANQGEFGRNPPLVQRFRNGRFTIQLRWNENKVQTGDQLKDDSKRIDIFSEQGFPRNTWVDFVYHVKWSWKGQGIVQVYRRILPDQTFQQIANYRGPVGYNDDLGPYFKFGLYRDDVPFTDVIYFDNYQRTQEPQKLLFREALH
ncbi:MAG: polysaccharide lyase [Bdellovibrio sp.]|nr:polysaccharide lyase [Bdellovibrio sp.]